MDLESQIRHVHGPEEVIYGLDELVVVCLVRDGRPYLKSFVEHYFSLGVKHIVFLDNGSSDGTVSTARSYENVTVLQTELPYKEHKHFMKRYLINRFGRGRWILCVDVDELFDYPYSDLVGLSSFLRYLTEKSYTAVVAQMLNMFPQKLVPYATKLKDEPLKELHRFYDISNITTQDYSTFRQTNNTVASDEIKVYKGGINSTVFEQRALLTKHPLMFLDDEIRPNYPKSHWVGRARVADITCVLFHYKFIGDFYERTVRAVKEENYWNNSAKYKKFLKALEQNPELQIKRETAQELKDVNDLVDNQFLVVPGDYMAWVDEEERKSEPAGIMRRRVEKLESSLAEERRRIKLLERKNQNLERQIQDIQGSRSWKLLGKLGRIRARMVGKR